MKPLCAFATLTVAVLVPIGLLSFRAAGPGAVQIGDSTKYTFRETPINGMGVKRLEDLHGKPVLVDFWGTHCPPCIGAAVPASVKLQETFGEDLQVIFVESQGSNIQQVEGFALSYKWMGGRAMWTTEHPFDSGFNTLPNFVLLGNDGKVLMKGNPLDQPKEIERQIAEQIKLARSAPADAHKAVKPAWSEFNKGKIAKACELARAMVNDPAGKEDVVAAAKDAMTTFEARVAADLKRVGWMIENGYFEEAAALVDTLKKGVKGDADLEKTVGEAEAKLDAPDAKAECEAAKVFARMASKYYQSGGEPAAKKDLEGFAKKYASTKAGARAQHLVALPKPGVEK